MPHSPEIPDEPAFRSRLARALGPEYDLGPIVGQGGFGRVYDGRHRRLDRRVAIKVIRPDLAGAAAFVDRFRREGVALARLRHPSIVPIFDIMERDGLIFYSMPFIDGPTLALKLDHRGPLPPKVAHRILLELCEAVAATHRAGILHRDIKPANVILEGTNEKVLLTDFGIARVAGAQDITENGVMIGTPTYMAPELIGNAASDARSDIYSLGVVAYHLLTGRPPFSGSTAAEVMVMHATMRPRSIRSINPSVPMALADAVDRCLEKDPADRFDSVPDLSEQLLRVTFFSELGAPAPDVPPVLGHHTYLFAVGAAVAALLAWLGAAWIADLRPWQLWTLSAGCGLLSILASPRIRMEWHRFAARIRRRSGSWRAVDES